MIKVFISPSFDNPDNGDGGIRRVVEAQKKYLPLFGIEVTTDINQADLVACHGMSFEDVPDKPLVHHNHGLYWYDVHPDTVDVWHPGHYYANREIINIMSKSDAITVPSNWVGVALSRGHLIPPEVIYHGVHEIPENKNPQGYVLWNKARKDVVSDPVDMNRLASILPHVPFVSTLGSKTPNVQITGIVPHLTALDMLSKASVYLATARETLGIGTIEALAYGVPVVGWDYGGQSEIIIHGETGYLAPYGDYEKLAECVELAFKNRDKLSKNAINDVKSRWMWQDKIEQYADLYKRVINEQKNQIDVSIVVTCHNLAKYLPDCLGSVMDQTFNGSWECIIVEDQTIYLQGGFGSETVELITHGWEWPDIV